MIQFHRSVEHYVDDDGTIRKYGQTLKDALQATKLIILAVNYVMATEELGEVHMLPYFQEYFGSHDVGKQNKVKAVLRKWHCFVEQNQNANTTVTICVGQRLFCRLTSLPTRY